MARKKRTSSAKYDLVIKTQGTSSRILEVGQAIVRIESTSKGTASGKLYSGSHWDTVEATMQPDGTAQLSVKYMQMTPKGEMIMGTGVVTQEHPNTKGIAQFTGQGTMWTSSPRLSQLNGGRWNCDGEYDMNKEAAEIRVNFDTSTI